MMAENCTSNERKLGSFALANLATFLATFTFHRQRKGTHQTEHRPLLDHPSASDPELWFFKGILIATVTLLSNCLNGFLIRETLGYEGVPVVQLILLWCSLPRLRWLTIWPIAIQQSEAANLSTAAPSLLSELILQFLSLYSMFLAVKYGLENNFYVRSLENAERGQSAKVMYYAALLWLIIATLPFVQSIRTLLYRSNRPVRPDRTSFPKRHRSKRTTSSTAEKPTGQLEEYWTCLEDYLTHHWIAMSSVSRETSAMSSERGTYTAYGTLRIEKNG
jgi:hypothetical protein